MPNPSMQAFAKTLDERLKAMGAEYEAKVADAQARADKMTQTEKDMAVGRSRSLEQRIQAAREKGTGRPGQTGRRVAPPDGGEGHGGDQ
jgi:hypothetical protein